MFWTVEAKDMLPEVEPREPVEVTAAAKVRAPEVEVTVVPAPIVATPVTVMARATEESVPPPEVVSVPPIVEAEVTKDAVPLPLIEAKSLKVTPVTDCVAVPATRTVPAPAENVPALVKSLTRDNTPVPPRVTAPAAFVKAPVVVAVPEPMSKIPLF